MTIGQRIAQKRKELALSQEALGEQLGVSRQSVYKWESDAAVPEIDKLIALSRLFSVTVGWLLGVEEPERETVEEVPDGPKSGELNGEQMQMVQEIVQRYLAAQRPAKKRRWPRVLAAAAAILLVVKITDLSGQLNTLNSRYQSLQNAVGNINSNVSRQMNHLTNRMEEILESQNSLLADYSVELAGVSVPDGTLTLRARATPKTWVEGMTALFIVDTGEALEEFSAHEQPSHSFEAELVCTLTDMTRVSVVFAVGDTRETQVLFDRTGYLSETFPYADTDGHSLMRKEVDKNGNIQFGVMQAEYAYLYESAPLGGDVPVAAVREVKVGLFVDRKLICWLTPVEGVPQNYVGDWNDAQFYQYPTMTLPVKEDNIFCVATLIIDEYGREKLYPGIPYALDTERGELFYADERIEEMGDWYDTAAWEYSY